MRRYLDVADTAPLGPPGTADEQRKPVRVALLRAPPPSAALAAESPADAVLQAPSASRENSINSTTSWEVVGSSSPPPPWVPYSEGGRGE